MRAPARHGGCRRGFACLLALPLLAACGASTPSEGPERDTVAIYWSDGDSGRLHGEKFRLANVDAPETGGVGARGGAKCEDERELGFEAKAWVVELTRENTPVITRRHGADRYGREVVDLAVAGRDLATRAVSAGHLAPWPHRGGRALAPKPDWCG